MMETLSTSISQNLNGSVEYKTYHKMTERDWLLAIEMRERQFLTKKEIRFLLNISDACLRKGFKKRGIK